MFRKTAIALAAFVIVLAGASLSSGQVLSGVPGEPIESLPDVQDTYGTSETSYVMGAYDFDQFNTSTTLGGQPGTGDRFFTSAGGFLLATAHIPNGAQILRMELQGCDTSAGTVTVSLFSNTTIGGTQSEQFHGSVATSGTPGCGFFSGTFATPVTVNNQTRTYYVQVTAGAADSTNRFSAVRLFYRLQVSAAPATATFPNDVPTTHPFFRFVEALARSGVTGGCGAGSYCPDQAVTRGQMAVFLATALGLHFPN